VLGTRHARMNKTFFYGWSTGPLSVSLLLLKTRKSNQSEGRRMTMPSSVPINKAVIITGDPAALSTVTSGGMR
jgi:hypothetical protein